MHRIVPMGNSYGYDLLVLVRLGTLRICAPNSRLTLAFGACWSRMHSTKAWAFQDIALHHDRTLRNMRIADSDIFSSHDLFGTYRRKCTDAICPVAWHLVQTRFGHAFVLRLCPDVLHTVQYFGQSSYPVTCAAEPQ